MTGGARVLGRAGVAQLARVSAFQAEGCGFETRLPLQFYFCPCGSGVEHTLGKGEVVSSSLTMGSMFRNLCWVFVLASLIFKF